MNKNQVALEQHQIRPSIIQRKNMFWQKRNNKKEPVCLGKNETKVSGYIEIYDLSQRLMFLNQLVSRIEELSVVERNQAGFL